LLETVAEWVDSLLSLGWSGLGAVGLAEGRRLSDALAQLELHQCANALRALLEALSDPAAPDAASRADSVGRLCIALELTREAWQLDRLAGGSSPKVRTDLP
jgi:hypothetical protein